MFYLKVNHLTIKNNSEEWNYMRLPDLSQKHFDGFTVEYSAKTIFVLTAAIFF